MITPKSLASADRTSAAEPLPKALNNRFYRTVWRWHFYAGLFVIPFMLILGVTGTIYLFKPQLDAAMYHNLMFVQPGNSMLPYAEQVQVAQGLILGRWLLSSRPMSRLIAALKSWLPAISKT